MRRNMLWWQISNPTGESPDHLHLRSSKQQLHIFAPRNKIKQTKTSEADGLLFLKLFLSDVRGRWDPQGTAMPAPTSQPVERGAPVPALQTSQGCGFCCPWTNGCAVSLDVQFCIWNWHARKARVVLLMMLFLLVPYLARLSTVL